MDNRLLIPLLVLSVWLCLAMPGRAQLAYPGNWQQSANWQRNGATLDLDFANDRYWLGTIASPFTGTAYSGIVTFISASGATFSRSSTATYFDAGGVMQTAAAGTPRLDHDSATGEAKGILIEESRTNLATSSIWFESWSLLNSPGGNGLVSADTTAAPDGTTTADTISNSGMAQTNVYRPLVPAANSGTSFTFSVWAKDKTGTALLAFGGASDLTSFPVASISSGSAWTRYSVTATTSTNNGKVYPQISVAGGSSVAVWGGQLEQGSFPTSYIPTASAAVTRAADVLTIPLGSWFDSTQGTFISRSNTFDNNPYSNDYRRHVWLVSESGFTRLSLRAAIGQSGNTNAPHGVIGDGAAAYSLIPAVTVAGNVFTKAALAYSAASPPGAGLSVDGAATVASAHACTPDTSTGLLVGGATVGNQRQLAGYISRLTYMPIRQPDASLSDYTR